MHVYSIDSTLPRPSKIHASLAGGVRKSPLRSQLLPQLAGVDLNSPLFEGDQSNPAPGAGGTLFDPDTMLPFPTASVGEESDRQESSPYVSDLDTFTAENFFLDTSRHLKAVLFTKKALVSCPRVRLLGYTPLRPRHPSARTCALTLACIQQVPSLWRQIAEQHAHVALFGVVRQSEADLLDRFSITSHDLPKVVIFCPGV